MKRTTAFRTILKCFSYVVLFFGLQLTAEALVSGFLGFVAAFSDGKFSMEDAELAATRVIYETLILSGLIFFGYIFLRKYKNFSEETSFKKTSPAAVGTSVFVGLGAFGIINVFLAVLMSALPIFQQSQDGYMEQQTMIEAAQPAFWAEFVYACIAAPILEELLCRGLILNTLKEHFNMKKAIILSAVFFACIHGNLYQITFTLPLGILLGWVAYRFDSIWPSIVIHAFFNFSNYPAMFCVELGLPTEHRITNFVYLAWMLLCFFSIPIGILLLKNTLKKTPAPPPHVRINDLIPEEKPAPRHGSEPPFQQGYYGQGNFGPNGQGNFGPNGQGNFGPNGQGNFGPGGQNNFGPNGQGNFGPNGQGNFGPGGAPFQPPFQPPYAPPFAPPAGPQFQNQQGGFMAAPEYLVVGLGNPGDKYAQNRHNVGFMALDYIALRENVTIQNLRFKALTGECIIGGKKVLLMKPQTFMNLSGEAVREAAAFFRIPPEKILVIFDDINFEPGVFRIRSGGSAGGHNGIKSIISCLGTDAFPRVKLGVGTPPPQWELMNWVLGNPAPADQKKIIASLEDVYDSAKQFTDGKLDRAAALYNGKIHE